MSGGSSVSQIRLLDTERAREAIRVALRREISHEGKKRDMEPEDVAEILSDAGHKISARGVSAWVCGSDENRRTPDGHVLLLLFQILGKRFTTKALSAIGQGAYDLSPVRAAPASVVATLATTTAEFASRGVDQVFDNPELGELEPIADAAIAVLEPFSSKRAC